MRRRTLLEDKNSGNGVVDGSKATPMSVVFANKNDGSITIVEGDKWNTSSYPASTFEPIGIVVIPGEHGVLKDGTGTVNQCGVMSLVPMNYNTPEKGGTSEQGMYWGYLNLDISNKKDGLGRHDSISNGLTNYNEVNIMGNYWGSNDYDDIYETVQGTEEIAYLPSDAFFGIKNPFDDKTAYYDKNYFNSAPSPYKNDGSYNTAYGQTTSPGSETNALSDFKGIVNTKIITDLATSQTNWKTASAITNSYQSGYYPAACCCARFKTTGTKAFVDCTTEELRNGSGFWYMPALGELGYMIVRLKAINATIDKLKTAYGIGVRLEIGDAYIWSSSEYYSSYARCIRTDCGEVTSWSKSDGRSSVNAFLRL